VAFNPTKNDKASDPYPEEDKKGAFQEIVQVVVFVGLRDEGSSVSAIVGTTTVVMGDGIAARRIAQKTNRRRPHCRKESPPRMGGFIHTRRIEKRRRRTDRVVTDCGSDVDDGIL